MVSPRVRAGLFAAGALACGLLSAALAGGAAVQSGNGLGEAPPRRGHGGAARAGRLTRSFDRGGSARGAAGACRLRAPDALRLPAEALGRRLAVSLPAGSYLTAASLAAGAEPRNGRGSPPRGTTPVEITVVGAGALEASRTEAGAAVDVVVSGEPGPGPAAGRTRVATEGVPLLALRKAPAETGLGSDRWVATLALTRGQALRLIRADSAAASIRLLAR